MMITSRVLTYSSACLLLIAEGEVMFTTAIPKVPEKSAIHPAGGGSEGAIASVTAWGSARGEAYMIGKERDTTTR